MDFARATMDDKKNVLSSSGHTFLYPAIYFHIAFALSPQ
jgi:hypothetical protein